MDQINQKHVILLLVLHNWKHNYTRYKHSMVRRRTTIHLVSVVVLVPHPVLTHIPNVLVVGGSVLVVVVSVHIVVVVVAAAEAVMVHVPLHRYLVCLPMKYNVDGMLVYVFDVVKMVIVRFPVPILSPLSRQKTSSADAVSSQPAYT